MTSRNRARAQKVPWHVAATRLLAILAVVAALACWPLAVFTDINSGESKSTAKADAEKARKEDMVRLKRQLNSWAYRKSHRHGDVEPLPENRSPQSDEWDNSVAICAIMKGENTTDVREWLMYHRWLGVDKVYLMENVDKPTDELLEQIDDFINDGFVEYTNLGTSVYQLIYYRECMDNYHHLHNWMTFIDLDEYIVIKDKEYDSLPEFLDQYKEYPGLVMHWSLMGPSGKKNRPEQGGMIRHYDQCRGLPGDLVKTVANTYYLANIAGNPHTFEYRDNGRAVNERKEEWRWRFEPECAEDLKSNATYEEQVSCRKIPDRQDRVIRPNARITVNHYITKSEEDFRVKVERGSGGGTSRTWREFHEMKAEQTRNKNIQNRNGNVSGLPGIAVDDCPWARDVADECCPLDQYILNAHKSDKSKDL